MAATTISRASLTDGVSLWNAALVGTAIYDKIDTLIAGAVTFGGVVGSEGFGVHSFAAGGTGRNALFVRNTTAGTGNYAECQVWNDASKGLQLRAFSTTWTTSAQNVQDGCSVDSTGAGGLSVAATHASGAVRFYAGGTTERGQFDASGNLHVHYGMRFTGSYDQSITGTQALDSAGQHYVIIRLTSCTSTPKISQASAGNDGDIKIIVNVSGASCTVQHNSGTPGQRIYCANGTDGTIADDEAMMIIYDAGSSSWIEIGPR